jgi:hypothetical protein
MLPADLRRLRSLSLMWEDGRAGQVSYKKRAKSWNKDGTYDQLLWQQRVAAAAVADVVIG